jgi:surface antigen
MTTSAFHRCRSTGIVAVSIVTALFAFGTVQAAAADTVTCTSDLCDGGLWATARGADNDLSYWGMNAGHNCTNYVAWRLIQDGVARPDTNPGDATNWAVNAKTDGYPVDHTPLVGAVAEWDGSAGGNGSLGHVAYVEKVNDDGTILISEDFWHNGDQLGPLTYRTIPVFGVSNFIHYADMSTWLRSGTLLGDQWGVRASGLDPTTQGIAAINIGGSAEVFYSENGQLWQSHQGADAWTSTATGVKSSATSLSVVTMDGTRPYIMSIDYGALIMTVKTASGWLRMSTGFKVTGQIDAVNLGGLWPTVYLSQDGALWHIWGDTEGWHSEPTGVETWGQISAVVDARGWPEIFNVKGGMLFRSWLDESGWQTESTGIAANGQISAVTTPTGTQVMLVQDKTLYRIVTDGLTWTASTSGLSGGESLSAIDLGGVAPAVFQIG